MIARLVLSSALALTACGKAASTSEPPRTGSPAAPGHGDRFEIRVTEHGFEPDETKVPAGKPVTLVFERKTDETCAKEVILTLADGSKIEKPLPLDTPVEIATTFPSAGKLTYACGMDMLKGTIAVE